MTDGHASKEAPHTHGATIRWWAPLYDAAAAAMAFGQLGRIRKETVRLAGVKKGDAVLDVGCGTGSLTMKAARKAGPDGRVAGIDASPEMIAVASAKATKRGLDIDYRAAAIESLPFADAEFDVVLSSLMLHHLPDEVKQAGLREVRRVLKPGGRLLAVDIAGRGMINRLMGLFGHKMPPDYAERLTGMMKAAGFEGVEQPPSKQKGLLFLRAS